MPIACEDEQEKIPSTRNYWEDRGIKTCISGTHIVEERIRAYHGEPGGEVVIHDYTRIDDWAGSMGERPDEWKHTIREEEIEVGAGEESVLPVSGRKIIGLPAE